MTRIFFHQKSAERFAESLRNQNYKAKIWTDKDGFGQRIFIVKWYEK